MGTNMKKTVGNHLPVVFQSMFIIALGNFIDSAYAPLAPFIKNYYLLTATQVGLITSILFIGSSSVSLFTGFLVDKIGYRNAMKLSFGIMALGSTILFSSKDYAILLSGFYFIGFGYGILTPATNSQVMKEYYPEHLTRMGIKQAGVPMGAALAAIALPLIVIKIGIPDIFVVVIAMAAIMLIILPFRKSLNRDKFSIVKYLGEMFETAKDRYLLLIGFSALFMSWSQQSVMTYYVLYFRNIKFGTLIAESFLYSVLISAIFGRILWTRLGNRMFNQNHIKTFSLIMVSAAAVIILLPHFSTDIYMAYIFSIFVGITAISWNGVFVSMTSEIAPPCKVGMYSGIGILLISSGTILGTPISGMIIDHFHSYNLMWMVMGITLLVVGILLFFISNRMKITARRSN
jgi:ACS family hexuronate transporter-like MFS transporter